MRNVIKIVLCLCVMSCLGSNLYGQDMAGCKVIFNKAYQDFKTPGSGGYAMTYTMKSILVSGESNEEEVHVLFRDNNSYVETRHSKVYTDQSATVMIDDSDKLIFISKVMNASLKEAQFDQMAMLQDSLLNHDSEFKCQTMVAENGKSYAMVTVLPNADMKLSSGYEKLKYRIDQETEKIVEVNVDYVPNHPQLRQVLVSFSRYDKNFEGKVFEGAALARVYNEHGQLRKLYADYRVINNLIGQGTK